MAYCTITDMQTRFGASELIMLTNPGGVSVTTAVADSAINAADAEIDSYLGGRYAVPVAVTPVILRDCSMDIARYRLYDEVAHEVCRKNYEDRVSWLKMVARGEIMLQLPAPVADAVAAVASGFAYTAPDAGFTTVVW